MPALDDDIADALAAHIERCPALLPVLHIQGRLGHLLTRGATSNLSAQR